MRENEPAIPSVQEVRVSFCDGELDCTERVMLSECFHKYGTSFGLGENQKRETSQFCGGYEIIRASLRARGCLVCRTSSIPGELLPRERAIKVEVI